MEDERVMADAGGGCPDAEQLAQYVEGTLPDAHRAAIEVHLADCDPCRELVIEMTHVLSADAGQPGVAVPEPAPLVRQALVGTALNVPRRVWSLRSRRRVLACAFAAAAALVLAVRLQPTWLGFHEDSGTRVAALRAAVGAARPTPGRFSGFEHATYRAPTRGVSIDRPEDLELRAAARAAEETAESDPSTSNRHAWGVAQVLIRDWNGAIGTLESLSRQQPADAIVLNDLAAAYLARGEAMGQRGDLQQALQIAARALEADPAMLEPLFNEAVAHEALGEHDQAAEAWRKVLDRDPSSWRREAQQRLDALTQTVPRTP